jgi:hypothetical protein
MAKSKAVLVTRAVLTPMPEGHIESGILLIRGQKVLLDQHLADLYRVPVKRLNEAVKRNRERFPSDFMFQLTKQEFDNLRSQIATSSSYGGRRYPPYAFTEHGAVMLAAVLNSPVAVEASIQVVRAFVRLRQLLASDAGLRRKLDRLERKMKDHDEKFAIVFEAIRQLMDESAEEDTGRPRIGYEVEGRRRG